MEMWLFIVTLDVGVCVAVPQVV